MHSSVLTTASRSEKNSGEVKRLQMFIMCVVALAKNKLMLAKTPFRSSV